MSLKANFQKCFDEISDFRKADLFVFKAPIDNISSDRSIEQVNELESRRENCILFLTTPGGYIDPAYKLARFLKDNYENFILFVFGWCKSAGTLVALSADAIIMTDSGELGPLDEQIRSEEKVGRGQDSVLNTVQSLELLSEQAPKMFVKCLDGIIKYSYLENRFNQGFPIISVKVAESVAEDITKYLLGTISSQIDPQQFVASYRGAKITQEYAERLNPGLKETGVIDHLLTGYPSHEFVIDRKEAELLFQYTDKPVILKPRPIEEELALLLKENITADFIGNFETGIQNMEGDSDGDSQNPEEKKDEQTGDG